MGSVAQSLESYINPRFNYVIRCRHPSYYARSGTKMPTDIWQKAEDIVFGQTGQHIQWYDEY
jgi:uracil DNA glycosylase